MALKGKSGLIKALCLALSACLATAGCVTCPSGPDNTFAAMPKELKKVTHPPYIIEPPDILEIDAISVVPKPPYRVLPLDALLIRVTNTLPEEPIAGVFGVQPEGTVTLGPSYGAVSLVGMTLEEAREAIEKQLKSILKEPKASVSLGQSRALQQIRGEHLVTQDGTINLGVYGLVTVTGMTIPEAKAAIESQLSQYLEKPEIALSILGFNSKVYYIIFDGGGYGEQMVRLPVTGNETVLDAIAQVNGLPSISSLCHIWVARPAPDDLACDQILPVDWKAITSRGATASNYQIFPGDRIHVKADPLIATDNWLAKAFAPIERTFGATLLGTSVVRTLQRDSGGTGTGGTGGF